MCVVMKFQLINAYNSERANHGDKLQLINAYTEMAKWQIKDHKIMKEALHVISFNKNLTIFFKL